MAKKIRRIIVEDKDVKTLEPKHIRETVKKYRYPYCPDRYDINIPSRTRVPPRTRRLAKQRRNVNIRRLRFP